jgi:hypothetical protein
MSEAAVPDVGLLIDDLAIAYQKSFGASRIGARERLNAAHLVDTLNNFDAEPERIRGALRAALAKTKAEADLFDRVYPDAARREEAAHEPAPPSQAQPSDLAPQPTEKPRRNWLLIGAGVAVAIAVIAAAIFAFNAMRPAESNPEAAAIDPRLEAAANTRDLSSAPTTEAAGSIVATEDVSKIVDGSETAVYIEEISAILDRASEFGYRASPRELANAFASSFDMAEADLTRDIARNAAQSPDQPLDLFDLSTLAAVHAALHGPVASGMRDAVLPAAIVERARQQTEYLTFEDGRLVVHWREADAWSEQPLEAELIVDPVLEKLVSPDGTRALTRGVRISALWDLVGLKQIARVATPGATATISIPPEPRAMFIPGTNDGIVLGGNGSVYLTPAGAAAPPGLPANLSQFVTSSTGSGFAFVDGDGDGAIEIWDAATQRRRGSVRPAQAFTKIVVSDNLDLLLGAAGTEIEVWDTSGSLLRTLPLSMEYGDAYFVANDTRILLNHIGGVELYDVETGEVVSRFEEFLKDKQSAFGYRSVDGHKVFIEAVETATDLRHTELVDAETGETISSFAPPPSNGPTIDDVVAKSVKVIAGAPGLLSLEDENWYAEDGQFDFVDYTVVDSVRTTLAESTLVIPTGAAHYLNIPSMTEATARAAAFAKSHQVAALPDWPMWLAVAIPLLVAAVVLARPASWRKAYLSRRKIESDTLIRKLTANVTTFEPLAGERRAVGRLDQRLRQPSHRLDLRETVIATARAGGMFTPVADTDAGTPEYVALIERRRLTDADAARMVAFFNRLRSAGLSLTLYTYSGTPEALTPLRGGHAIPIETLRQRHAGAFLLITGDSARFHNRKTGGVATWTSRLGPVRRPGQGRSFAPTWSGGAFLSREPMPRLGPAERAIERDLGLVVRHTDAGDLTAIGDYFHGRSASLAPHDEEGHKPAPAYFANSPERLVEEEPPGVIERQDLAPQLEAWLGAEGLRWVRALAYYPIVQWDLALYLASSLMPHMSAEARAAMEAKVARLPWLEHGFMPDWVRQTLVEGADPKEEKRIVREIVAVMAEAREGADGNISFQLMDPASGAASEHTGDAIFIDAVARAKARPWDLPPPSQWLRRAPQALQMPWARMRIALAAIVLAAAAAIFTPHSGNMAPLAQWTPVLLFGLLAIAMAIGPTLITRYADRGRG